MQKDIFILITFIKFICYFSFILIYDFTLNNKFGALQSLDMETYRCNKALWPLASFEEFVLLMFEYNTCCT